MLPRSASSATLFDMTDRTGPLSVLLLLTNIALVLLLATPAHAQADVVTTGAAQLLDRGVLGVIVVIEGVVIWMLFREIRNQHAAQLSMLKETSDVQRAWIEKSTTLFTRVSDHMDRQDEDAKDRERSQPVPRAG